MEFYENNNSNVESVICPNDTYYGCTCEEQCLDDYMCDEEKCEDSCDEYG